ncbi:DUF6497 family protein [Paracoccus sp. N5]|uniref:DUF6497 family protein n=1 Tax=Paracoccus sp. N5 TaxID=1101189 RepID=UPI0003791B5E|nr:DUF6497 family protein [Paracoccus sp. N5]
MSRLAATCLALIPPALVAGGTAAAGAPVEIVLPSGAKVTWQETRHDSSGGLGLTYRFRFVMPDLAQRVPATSGPASDFEDAEGRGPIDIDTESGEVTGETATLEAEAEMAAGAGAETGAETGAGIGAEEDADALLEQPVLPAAPDVLAEDPIHLDIVWLCENWALPRIASPAPRPEQIVISLASKETTFGAYDPEVVQLFEAFRLPKDRDACEWEPW